MENISFAEYVIRERTKRGWSQRYLAQRSGITTTTICRLENEAAKPKPVTVKRILSAFSAHDPVLPDTVSSPL